MQKIIRPFLLVVLACFALNRVVATIIATDSIPVTRPWKISHQQFLDQYGKDDTARAIINYYFQQQARSRKPLYVFTPVTAGVIGVAIPVVTKPGSNSVMSGIVVFFILAVTGIFTLALWGHLMKYSRKKLMKMVNKYYCGKGVPGRLKKQLYAKRN